MFPRRRERLLNFHRPDRLGVSHPLKPESIACLRNLSAYRRPPAPGRYPRSRSAAVLVALFVGRGGDLYALLSRRSDGLRSYPGDTSLPGGKLERIDRSVENAAIGLPLDKRKVPLLCILEPFLAGNRTIVTPVVVLITDQTLRPILNEAEVQSIFSHPLLSFLTRTPLREPEPRPRHIFILQDRSDGDSQDTNSAAAAAAAAESDFSGAADTESSSPQIPGHVLGSPSDMSRPTSMYAFTPPERPYHTYKDILWHGKNVRLHSFLTGREAEGVKPIFGLTSSILIRTAQIGYKREPEFEVCAPGQAGLTERIAVAMREEEELRRACWEEGIESDWGLKDGEKKYRGSRAHKAGRL